MTTLLMIRHGQTRWNRESRFRGRTDLPLDEIGVKQAQAVARRIAADHHPLVIGTSPLQSAVETADIIARPLGLSVQRLEGLVGLDFGDLAGLDPAEAEAQHACLYRAWLAAPHTVRFPNGESLMDVRERADSLLQEVADDCPSDTVVLVTHLAVAQVLLCCLLGIHNGYAARFQLDSGSLTICQVDPTSRRLVLANDTCHLILRG